MTTANTRLSLPGDWRPWRPVCGRDLDEDRGSLIEPLGGLVVDGWSRVLLGIWRGGRHRRFLFPDGPHDIQIGSLLAALLPRPEPTDTATH